MARGSLNKVMLIGRLGQDPELRYTQQGASVCSFSLATDEGYKDQTGNMVEKTEWHRVVIWRKLAEIANQYLRKGSLVYIEGKLTTRMWEKDGHKNYTTEIIASDMTMLGGKGDSVPVSQSADNSSNSMNQSSSNNSDSVPPPPSFDVPNTDFEEDDLPF